MGQVRRPGGYGSSMHGLKMHMGRYEELDFFDVLNDPSMNPDMDRRPIHELEEWNWGVLTDNWLRSFHILILQFNHPTKLFILAAFGGLEITMSVVIVGSKIKSWRIGQLMIENLLANELWENILISCCPVLTLWYFWLLHIRLSMLLVEWLPLHSHYWWKLHWLHSFFQE